MPGWTNLSGHVIAGAGLLTSSGSSSREGDAQDARPIARILPPAGNQLHLVGHLGGTGVSPSVRLMEHYAVVENVFPP